MANKSFQTLTVLALLTASACSSVANDAKGDDKQAVTEANPKIGKEVSNVCFASTISGFETLDKKSVIIRKGVNDKYLVTVMGGCTQLDDAQSIGLDSRSSCVSRGDALIVSDSLFSGRTAGIGPERCTISRIYEWNEDAAAITESESATESEGQDGR